MLDLINLRNIFTEFVATILSKGLALKFLGCETVIAEINPILCQTLPAYKYFSLTSTRRVNDTSI